MSATGTVYGLTDPRNGEIRYVGQTVQTLPKRLHGHLGKPMSTVGPWIAELKADGLKPLIVALRENVPQPELRSAERAEITRILVGGGTLLNEQLTGEGTQIYHQACAAGKRAAEQAAWAEIAVAAVETLGGPLPPGDLPFVPIPEPIPGMPADVRLWRQMGPAWGELRGLADNAMSKRLKWGCEEAAEMTFAAGGEASRFVGLLAWFAVAVDPWRHLAQISGLPSVGTEFAAWVGRDSATREALEFHATLRPRIINLLTHDWEHQRWQHEGSGRMLGAVFAAHGGLSPAPAIRPAIAEVLARFGADHQLTEPMGRLFATVDPSALDKTFGNDVAAELDLKLGLKPGTSGLVLREFASRPDAHYDRSVQRAADRSAEAFPVVALPDYAGWSGFTVPMARAISASLVRAGLAAPAKLTADEYIAEVRELWVPDLDRRMSQAA